MSRYEKLCQSAATALGNYEDYRVRASTFLRDRFLPGLVKFLEAPSGKIRFFDFDGSFDGEHQLNKLMRCDERCNWTVGIAIKLEHGNSFTDQGLQLQCKEVDGDFVVEIAGRTWFMRSDADLESCYLHIFEHIKDGNESGLNDSIRAGGTHRIGFHAG